jgi:hypothetical protein
MMREVWLVIFDLRFALCALPSAISHLASAICHLEAQAMRDA